MKSQKFNVSDLIQSAQAATELEMSLGGGDADCVPKDFHTREWWGKIWNLSDSTVRWRIRNHISAGRMEKKDFRVTSNDRVIPIPHYRAVKPHK